MLLLVTRSSEFKQRAEECSFWALIAGEIGVRAVRSPSREEPFWPAQKILVCTGIGRGGMLRNISVLPALASEYPCNSSIVLFRPWKSSLGWQGFLLECHTFHTIYKENGCLFIVILCGGKSLKWNKL